LDIILVLLSSLFFFVTTFFSDISAMRPGYYVCETEEDAKSVESLYASNTANFDDVVGVGNYEEVTCSSGGAAYEEVGSSSLSVVENRYEEASSSPRGDGYEEIMGLSGNYDDISSGSKCVTGGTDSGGNYEEDFGSTIQTANYEDSEGKK
jgi:hypothetical protein